MRDRMDALDEMHPIHTEGDEGSENVEADEREGNNNFIQRQASSEKEVHSEMNEDTAQSNFYNQVEIEKRMDRMNLNLNLPPNGKIMNYLIIFINFCAIDLLLMM